MKTQISFLIVVALAYMYACGPKLKYEPSVEPLSVATVEVDSSFLQTEEKLLVEGLIISEGDGMKDYGHIWTVDVSNPNVDTWVRAALAEEKDDLGFFSSEVDVAKENETYRFCAFIRDDFGEVRYGEVKEFDKIGDEAHAKFTFTSDNEFYAPTKISFTNMSSNYENFEWDFGEGTTDNQNEDPMFVYPLPGEYRVILHVSGSKGEDRDTQYINIKYRQFEVPFSELGEGVEVLTLPDGGYIAAGTNQSSSNIYVVRLEADGTLGQNGFKRTYPHSGFDFAKDIIQIDDGFIVVGYTNSVSETQRDILFLWIGPDGAPKKGPVAISTPDSDQYDDLATCATLTSENMILIAGYGKEIGGEGGNDVFSIVVDPNLDSSTGARRISHDGIEEPTDVIRIGEDYFLTGKIIEGGEKDALFLRIGEDGQPVSGPLGLGVEGSDEGFSIQEGPNAELWIGGFSSAAGTGTRDMYIFRVDDNGNEQGAIHGDDGGSEEANDFVILGSSGVVFAGKKDNKLLMLGQPGEGQSQWVEDFGGASGHFNALKATPDGGFVAVGKKNNGFYLAKTNNLGKIQ